MSDQAGTKQRELIPLNMTVLVLSDSRTEKTDKSGELLVGRLEQARLCHAFYSS